MIQTKTIAMIFLIAVAVVGTIGIGTTEHAFAQFGRGPGQNDNSQSNDNNQQAGSCRGGQSFCQNLQGNQN